MQNFVSGWVDGYCSVVLVTSVSVDAVKVVDVVGMDRMQVLVKVVMEADPYLVITQPYLLWDLAGDRSGLHSREPAK